MKNRFKNTYRTDSVRLQSWNYSWQGYYFVTICTKNRVPFFGEVKSGRVYLNQIGKLAHREWMETPEIRPDMNIKLDACVIMPNHLHGIISIGKNPYNDPAVEAHRHAPNDDTGNNPTPVETHCNASLRGRGLSQAFQTDGPQNRFGPQRKNLASIIRGFKGAVTRQARKMDPEFGWQSRFYEHIIRNEEELERISEYIMDNPRRWTEKQNLL